MLIISVLEKIKNIIYVSTKHLRRDSIEIRKIDRLNINSLNKFATYSYNKTENSILRELDKNDLYYNIVLDDEFIDNKSIYTWIIQPIIGFNNFKNGISEYATSITLIKNYKKEEQEIILSLVEFPSLGKTFYTDSHSKKSFVQYSDSTFQSLYINRKKDLTNSIISISHNNQSIDLIKCFIELEENKCNIMTTNNFIMDSINLIYGHYDAVIYDKINENEYLTMILFLINSKSFFTTTNNKQYNYYTNKEDNIIIANDSLNFKILKTIKNYYKK